jgi:hypothetical protein
MQQQRKIWQLGYQILSAYTNNCEALLDVVIGLLKRGDKPQVVIHAREEACFR